MSIPYRAEIDGLRALAILAVLGYHAFPSVFPGGFIGVDVFFVISGYLITSILIKEQNNGDFSIRGFYARRIIRILPALTLVIIACLLAGWFLLIAEEYKSLAKHALGGLGFVSNLVLWQETGYFDKAAELKPLLNLWSLGIEEQFYIAWPLVLLVLQRSGKRNIQIIWILTMVSFALSVWAVFNDRGQAFYSPLSRAWELLAGAILAFRRAPTEYSHKAAYITWLPALALVMLATAVFSFQSTYPFPGPLALIPVLSCAILIDHAQAKTPSRIYQFLSSKPAVWTGLISYPLYLWHWPLLSFSRIIHADEPPAFARAIVMLCSIALAYATYKLIERPAKRLSRRLVISVLIILSILAAIVSGHVFQKDGLERSRHKKIIAMSEQVREDFTDFEDRGLIKEGTCDLPFIFPDHPKRQICLVARHDQPQTALLIGDSHAVHAFWGLADAFVRIDQNLKVTGRGACVPFLGYTSPNNRYECQPHVDQILTSAAQMKDVRSVVLVFRGRYIGNQTSPDDYNEFLKAMERTVALFSRSGKKVYAFLPVVEPGFDPRLCAGTLPLGRTTPKNCTIDQVQDQRKSRMINEAWTTMKSRFPDLVVFDPNGVICAQEKCSVMQLGHSIFKDENHLSHFGSMLIGEHFKPR